MNQHEWLVRRGHITYPAPDLATLCSWAGIGRVGRHDTIWDPEARVWRPALDVPELAEIMTKPRPCPLDRTELAPAVVCDITIDRCPTCHGVWLDPGELDLVREKMKKEAGDEQFSSGLVTGMLLR